MTRSHPGRHSLTGLTSLAVALALVEGRVLLREAGWVLSDEGGWDFNQGPLGD